MNFNGNLRIAKCDKNGVVQGGYIGLLNPVKCELVTPAAANIDEISRFISSAGQILSRGQIPNPTTLNLETSTLSDQRVLAFALNGITATYSQSAATIAAQTGGSIVDEVVNAGARDVPVALANRQVSAVVVKNSAGSTTYTVGTDYTVDAANGAITPLSSGTITASQSLKVSYTAAALTGESVTAGELGDWIPLANRHVSAVVVKHTTGTPTYVPGVDYIVDAQPGFIQPLVGGAIAANQALKVTYNASAITGKTVQGSKVPSTLLRVEIQTADLVDQQEGYFIVPIYQSAASGNKDLFGKNLITAALAGAMLVPPQGSAAATETGGSPYIFTAIDAA